MNELTQAFLSELGINAEPLKALQALPVDAIIQAQQAVMPEFANHDGLAQTFAPCVHTPSLPQHPYHPQGSGLSAHIPLLIGFNETEATLFMGRDPDLRELDALGLAARCASMFGGHADRILKTYRRLYPHASNSDLLALISTGRMRYNVDTLELAVRKSAQPAPVYLYMLEWRTDAARGRLRCPHAMDIPLVFDNVEAAREFVGTGDGPQHLADLMSPAWLAFARTGHPGHAALPDWSPFTAEARAAMVFNLQPRLETGFRLDEHALWAPYFYQGVPQWVSPASIPTLPVPSEVASTVPQ